MKMNFNIDIEKCCGCLACKDSCVFDAITITTDTRGFIYPKINMDICVECNQCAQMCAFTNNKKNGSEIEKAFAFAISDETVINESSSGGAFTAISDIVLKDGGYVAGAVFKQDLSVQHVVTNDNKIRNQMRKSKYVQSNTEGIFKTTKQLLCDGSSVLFVGTPCQCNQMIQYAGENSKRLITCDFLCHGVPSYDFFKAHITYLENIFGAKVVEYIFRNKKFGWSHTEGVKLSSGKWIYSWRVQSYRKFFYDNVSLRPSCISCPYRSSKRYSDLTIADFWGANQKLNQKRFSHEGRGVSLVMANTTKGMEIANKLCNYGTACAIEPKDIQFKFSSRQPQIAVNESEFWTIYHQFGYEGLVNKYYTYSRKKEIKFMIRNLGRKLLRR